MSDVELSDVSSDESTDYETSAPVRGAAPVELTDLPDLVPNVGDPEEHAREQLAQFWEANPVSSQLFDNLSEEQLVALQKYMSDLGAKYRAELETLRESLQAEWWAKEQVLDQLLQASIGTTISPHTSGAEASEA